MHYAALAAVLKEDPAPLGRRSQESPQLMLGLSATEDTRARAALGRQPETDAPWAASRRRVPCRLRCERALSGPGLAGATIARLEPLRFWDALAPLPQAHQAEGSGRVCRRSSARGLGDDQDIRGAGNRGDIYLVVPPEQWSHATEIFENLDDYD